MAVGRRALEFATSGNNNVVMGWRAGDGLTTGDGNTFIGDQAGRNEPAVSNVVCLVPKVTDCRADCIQQNLYRQHSWGVMGTAHGLPVIGDRDGQLGTDASSRRFKKDIKPMDQASKGILKLKPVTFHYKDQDNKKPDMPQFGLIAEEVEKVNSDLVMRDRDGKVYSRALRCGERDVAQRVP